ncbi:hypothetical protein EJB05_47760 [Eragrostis curvula]|uniref:Uncharacterized protein n=1 Tax=Eragrostis curvula TaxID=38414 RepID=A0A5J9T070_9POAL|nr:hypothetical protein EJB05_47760 [Eragrostis curvula]
MGGRVLGGRHQSRARQSVQPAMSMQPRTRGQPTSAPSPSPSSSCPPRRGQPPLPDGARLDAVVFHERDTMGSLTFPSPWPDLPFSCSQKGLSSGGGQGGDWGVRWISSTGAQADLICMFMSSSKIQSRTWRCAAIDGQRASRCNGLLPTRRTLLLYHPLGAVKSSLSLFHPFFF